MAILPCKGKSALYHKYKVRAKAKKRKWELTPEQFSDITDMRCHYCGQKPYVRTVRAHSKEYKFMSVGVDRKSSVRGYTVANSLPCCWSCNDMKGHIPYVKFLRQVGRIVRHMHNV